MNDYLLTSEKVLNKYATTIMGLSGSQVGENLKKYGPNTLSKQKPESLLKRIWDAATEPIILMLIFAGIIALIVNIIRGFTGGETDYLEVVGVFLAISLSVSITVFMEGRSQKAFEALNEISNNIIVKVVRNGQVLTLPKEDLVVGDIIELSQGDKIPADCRVLEAVQTQVDESSLTGESEPVTKNEKALRDKKTPLAERSNMLYSGSYLTDGSARAVVVAVGDKTEIGKIAKELNVKNRSTTPLQEKLTRLGKQITVLGIIAASIVFITELVSFYLKGTLILTNVLDALVTSVVLIVAAVPEGLPTIVAVSLSLNVIKLARQNALVKKMIASETVGCIDVICSDKTGTLTENKMSVRSFYDTRPKQPEELDNKLLALNICVNSSADLDENGNYIGNPTEGALLKFYEGSKVKRDLNKSYKDLRNETVVKEVLPFNSERKYMKTVLNLDGQETELYKGSPEFILSNSNLQTGQKEAVNRAIREQEQKAMRILAFGHKNENTGPEMVFDGFVAIRDQLRPEVFEAVKTANRAGIETKILTGDNINTAKAIADELGILEENSVILSANDVDEMEDTELKELLPHLKLIARSTPAVKLRIVNLLKEEGRVVAVTGDGINDAPALKNADVGIAMGISGTEVSKEASDIVLLNDSFATIINAVEWGRNIYENFKRFISFQLTVNVASVICVFVSIILGLAAPFNALELLWINIIMDGPPALTLGLEPNYKDLLNRTPTDRSVNILTRPIYERIFLTALYESVIFLAQYITNFLNIPVHEQMTALFTLFVLFQLFNSFNCRELHDGSCFKHFFSNRLMLVIVSLAFVLQVVFIQYAGSFFGTVPLSFETWVKLFATASTVLILTEIVRFIMRTVRKQKKNYGSLVKKNTLENRN